MIVKNFIKKLADESGLKFIEKLKKKISLLRLLIFLKTIDIFDEVIGVKI